MRHIIHRVTAYLLILTMVLSLLPIPRAMAVEEQTGVEEILISDMQTHPEEETCPEEETQPEEETCPEEETQPEEETHPEEETQTEEETHPEEETQPEWEYTREIPDDFAVPYAGAPAVRGSSAGQRLPEAYDARTTGRVTPVKDQTPWQLCWAFSALAVGETQLISTGRAGRSIDLSERHLGYYFHGDAVDPLGNARGDGTYLAEDYLLSGNNNKFTTFALANWVGGAAESSYPYGADPARRERAAAMDDIAHLANAYWINASDTDNIKHYIMKNGSVGLSIYYMASCFNPETAAYYNDSYTATNHAITVVGWDDHFGAENFLDDPGKQGAWLCKNSVGTEFGRDGYFWLSYADRAITHTTATAFAFEFDSGSNYSWNYHYDGGFGVSTRGIPSGGSVASVYTASGSADGSDEAIQAVGMAVADTDLRYSVQIYRDLTDPANPSGGTPALAQPLRGTTHACGYYTIPLTDPVTVRHGETFAVVITLDSASGSDVRIFTDRTYNNGGWIRFVSATQPGQSFAQGESGSWKDLHDENVTARVKAYTSALDSRSVAWLTFEEETLYLAPGETVQQLPVIHPENADPCQLFWQSDDETVAAVASDGTVTAVNPGETAISVSTADGRVTASYRVSVKPAVEAINLLQYPQQMLVGEVFAPEAEIFPADAAPYYTISFTSSREEVVAVEGKELMALSPGTAEVTVWAKPYSVSFTVTVTLPIDEAQVDISDAVYDGTPAEPDVSVTLQGITLESGRDYDLTFENNTQPGTGTVIISGTGSYSGSLRRSFRIQLPRPQLLSVENESGGIRLRWQASPGVTGYRVYRQTEEGKWKKVKSVSGGEKETWLDSSVSSGTAYSYKIAAVAKCSGETHEGEDSAALTMTRLATPRIREIRPLPVGFAIRWKAVSGAQGYQILRTDEGGRMQTIAQVAADRKEYQDLTADAVGQQYHYQVIALGADGKSASGSSKAVSGIRPAAPAGLTAVNTQKGIALSWDAVEYAQQYRIWRSTDGVKWSKVKTLTAGQNPTWTDTSRRSGARVSYYVETLTELGDVTFPSAPCETISAYWLATPSGFKVEAVEDGFRLRWKKVSGADSYRILRSTDGAAPELVGQTPGGGTLQFVDASARETGKRYTYFLTAVKNTQDETVISAFSAGKIATDPTPVSLEQPVNTASGIQLRWSPVEQARQYRILRSSDGIRWSKIKTVSADREPAWTDTSRRSGAQVYYRVETVVKLQGVTFVSAPSRTVSTYRLSAPVIRKVEPADGGLWVTWKRVSGADGYLILRSTDGAPPQIVGQTTQSWVLSYGDPTATDAGKQYSYYVAALKETPEGTVVSALSPEKHP